MTRSGLALLGAWALVSAVYTFVSEEGLLTPDASVAVVPLLLGAATLGLRLVGLFVVLPLLLGAGVERMVSRWPASAGEDRANLSDRG